MTQRNFLLCYKIIDVTVTKKHDVFILTAIYMDSLQWVVIKCNECSTKLTMKTMKKWKIANFYEF